MRTVRWGVCPYARTGASSGVVARARWFVRARGSPKIIRVLLEILTTS